MKQLLVLFKIFGVFCLLTNVATSYKLVNILRLTWPPVFFSDAVTIIGCDIESPDRDNHFCIQIVISCFPFFMFEFTFKPPKNAQKFRSQIVSCNLL